MGKEQREFSINVPQFCKCSSVSRILGYLCFCHFATFHHPLPNLTFERSGSKFGMAASTLLNNCKTGQEWSHLSRKHFSQGAIITALDVVQRVSLNSISTFVLFLNFLDSSASGSRNFIMDNFLQPICVNFKNIQFSPIQ